MADKFIPSADEAFAQRARSFATRISENPEHYGVPVELAQQVMAAVEAFLRALQKTRNRAIRSMQTTAWKDKTRAEAERLMRRAAHFVQANPNLDPADLVVIGMKPRAKKLGRRQCPQERPRLWFVTTVCGAIYQGGIHVIRFDRGIEHKSRAKPKGADRLELFVELVPPDEPIPSFPGERHNGLTNYVGSYSCNPIEVEYPKSDRPMRVVYWGRWAKNGGKFGPYSPTLVARIEGTDWSQLALPEPADATPQLPHVEQRVTITSARRELPDCVETVDTISAESRRLLPEKTQDAA